MIASCANDPATPDDNLPQGYSRIELFLSAEPHFSQQNTRWNDANATDVEMMKSAVVIMKNDNSGNVERIINVNMAAGQWHERHSVGVITTENGSYTFYSFGNFPIASDDTTMVAGVCTTLKLNGMTFEVGKPIPADLETSTWQANFNGITPAKDDPGIPMSNKEQYTVSNTRSITLHLFRMLSKVSFQVTNKAEGEIYIRKIVMGEVTPDGTDIFFLPPKNGENIVNSFPAPGFVNDSLYAYSAEEGTDGIKLAPKGTHEFLACFNESSSQHPTGQMPLHITMTRNGGVVDSRYALMSLSNIPRNSYVVVPISLTDYMLELKAFFYAPIGGYPPYSIETKDKDFYCTFSAGGDFVLRPFVYKFEDKDRPENWFELTDNSKVAGYTLALTDNANIFSTEPYFAAGEILGTLNGTKGMASLRLNVSLRTANQEVIQEYTRTIYIIVE